METGFDIGTMKWLMRIGLGVYILLFVFVGMWMVTYVKGSGKSYIVCGKSMPLFFICTMFLAQAVDANSTMGAAAGTYDGGFWTGFTFPLGLALCLCITGRFFAAPLNKLHLLTLPDFYCRRYSSRTEWMVSIIMAFSFMILVAGNFAGSGWIVGYVFNLPYELALVIISTLIFIYTIFGGLFASAATNAIQIYPAVIGFAAAAIWLLFEPNGGWENIKAALPAAKVGGDAVNFYNLAGLTKINNGALINVAGLMALAFGDVIALDFMERVFSAKTEHVAKKGCYIAAVLTLVVGVSSCIIGLAAYHYFNINPTISNDAVNDTRMVMPVMALQIMPFGLGLLVISGIIGAGASTASGGLLGVSTVISRNLYQKNFHRWLLKRKGIDFTKVDQSEESRAKFDSKLLLISRLLAVPVVIAAIIFAIIKPTPGVLLVLSFDVSFAGCLAPLVLGIYWKKANTPGAMAAIVLGSATRLVLYIAMLDYSGPWAGIETIISPTVSFVAMFIVSSLTYKTSIPKTHILNEVPSEADVLAGLA